MEVTLHSYRNPTGRCDKCQVGTQPGCCDETLVRSASEQCPLTSACDTAFTYCVERNRVTTCPVFSGSYLENTNSIILEGTEDELENPIEFRGEEPWNVSCKEGLSNMLHADRLLVEVVCHGIKFKS